MEEILALKKKNSSNSPTKIKEILQQISNTRLDSDKISYKLEENETRINELSKEVFTLREQFESETQILESKINESVEQKSLLENLNEEKENASLSLKELETQHKTMKRTKPSLSDQQLLETGKRKHKLYKEFTGIRWDYSAPENVIEGFITNKKDFIEKISYKCDTGYKTIRELLWRDIRCSTMESKAREECCKENKPVNK
ncbi:uncharacterized protein LOC131668795 [Phymastichus coffea]|uniref:uncharacterized protein LOC131668795 n=1 Tax=Phymastichus coffea TaxID=108790 RepID=UPI00273B161F|nr:uncharacterized protein LOC131668795 [Phymastichus coffea]